jgi:TctA family transporter
MIDNFTFVFGLMLSFIVGMLFAIVLNDLIEQKQEKKQ